MVTTQALATTGFTLVVVAYLAQLYKTYTSKQSNGISLNGYLVTLVNLIGYIVWSKGTIGGFKFVELLLHVSTLLLILIYAPKTKIDTKSFGVFVAAFVGSLLLIGGLAQAHKSYTHPHESAVSIIHYLTLFIANLLYLSVAFMEGERINVFIGLFITNIFYMYILRQSVTNRLR